MLIHSDQSLDQIFSDIKHEVNRALHDKKHPFRYLTIASHDQKSVSLRYVVLRDITKDFEIIIFTDSRSEKVDQLISNPQTEILFYHPSKKLQLRISGTADIHNSDEVSKVYWEKQNDHSAKAYNSIIKPGEIIDRPETAHSWPENMTDKFFTVIKINPEKIDVLQLNKSEHLRACFEKTKNVWKKHWIAP